MLLTHPEIQIWQQVFLSPVKSPKNIDHYGTVPALDLITGALYSFNVFIIFLTKLTCLS